MSCFSFFSLADCLFL